MKTRLLWNQKPWLFAAGEYVRYRGKFALVLQCARSEYCQIGLIDGLGPKPRVTARTCLAAPLPPATKIKNQHDRLTFQYM